MKKYSLLNVLVLTVYIAAANEEPIKLYSPQDKTYLQQAGRTNDFEENALDQIVDSINHADLNAFKNIESELAAQGIRIYQARFSGYSLLQLTIRFYEEDIYRRTITAKQASTFVDYILSQMTPIELNEYVYGCWESGNYFGTAVAFAACFSPTCFSKIISHPNFDHTNFLTPQEVLHHRCEGWQPYTSFTPEDCLNYVRWNENRSTIAKINAPRLILLLQTFIENYPAQNS